MSALRLLERRFMGQTWYRLVRRDGRVFAGGLKSPEEADSSARQARHTITGRFVFPSPLNARPAPLHRKEAAKCCAATRDEYGRYCLGYCSAECERRP